MYKFITVLAQLLAFVGHWFWKNRF